VKRNLKVKSARTEYLARASQIAERAEAEARSLTSEERKEVNDCLEHVRDIKANEAWAEGRISDMPRDVWERRRNQEDQAELQKAIEDMNGRLNGGGMSFGDAVFRAGFSLKAQPQVTIPVASALTKAPTFPAVGDWNRLAPVTVPMGTDRRWLYPNLVSQSVGAESAVQDFRQTVRTLTGSVQRNLDAATTKANVDTTLTLVTESLSQFAVTVNEIPNAVLESISTARDWLNGEMQFQVQKPWTLTPSARLWRRVYPSATPARIPSQESGTRSGPCAARVPTQTCW
jgi:hypothetical protein